MDKSLHTGHLGKVAERTASARLHHIRHRAHRIQFCGNLLFNRLLRTLPNLNRHTALLLFGEQTILVIPLNLRDLDSRLADYARLLLRHRDIVDGPRDTRASRVVKAEPLHLVHDSGYRIKPVARDAVGHDAREHLLGDGLVDKRIVRGQHGVEEESTNRRLKRVAIKGLVLLLPLYR